MLLLSITPSVFAQLDYTFALGNTSGDTFVGTLTLATTDSYQLGSANADRFSIVSTTTATSTTVDLRYIGSGGEDVTLTPSYTLSLIADNGAGSIGDVNVLITVGTAAYTLKVRGVDSTSNALFARAAVGVLINNVNDNTPVFETASYTFSLSENVAGTLSLGSVSASDEDGDEVNYSLSVGDAGLFSVGVTDGVLSYIGKEEDAEVTAVYTLEVRGVDSTSEALFATVAVVVVVEITGVDICSRTPKVEEAILDSLGLSVSDCSNVSSSSLASIVYLKIEGIPKSIQARVTQESSDFGYLTGLKTLDLSDSNISELKNFNLNGLYRALFEDLGNLETLNLNNNKLELVVDNFDNTLSIDANVFEPLVNLKNLYLLINQLGEGEELPSVFFQDLSSLEALDIGDNIISTLPNGIFSPLSNLELLNLNSNEFPTLPLSIFGGLQKLKFLTLYNNDFAVQEGIPPGVFHGLTGLQILDLSGNPYDQTAISFNFSYDLEQLGTSFYRVKSSHGGVRVSANWRAAVDNSTFDSGVVTVEAGAESASFAIDMSTIPLSATTFAVTLDQVNFDPTEVSLANPSGYVQYAIANEVVYSASHPDYEVAPGVTLINGVSELVGHLRPMFETVSYAFSLSENSPGALELGLVSASDEDGDEVNYSLSVGDAGLFSVGVTGGVLSYIGKGEDYEGATTVYTLEIQAFDSPLNAFFATVAVVVEITDVDEVLMFETSNYTFSLSENSPGALELGSVSASDGDGDGGEVNYSLSVGDAGLFSVGVTDGVLSYIGNGEDTEGTAAYTLEVRGVDSTSNALFAAAAVFVLINNVNDNTPEFETASYAFSLPENSAGPVALGSVSASDKDGDEVNYSLSVGDEGLFSVGVTDGVLSYLGPGEDYESTDSYTLEVRGVDSTSNALFAAAAVFVLITDENDNLPVFETASYAFSLSENRAGTFALGSVSASDLDGGEVNYSLSVGDEGLFSVGVTDGVLSYIGKGEDAESMDSYTLEVRSVDSTSEELFAKAAVFVLITDENDNLPVFETVSYAFSLSEDRSGTFSLGSVSASDEDGDEVNYRLSVGDAGLFSVGVTDGVLSYIGYGWGVELSRRGGL